MTENTDDILLGSLKSGEMFYDAESRICIVNDVRNQNLTSSVSDEVFYTEMPTGLLKRGKSWFVVKFCSIKFS